jgi:hypothetical protein
MKPVSKFWKRFVAGVIGVLFAVLYGFWTMLATGGGHVNFIWFFLFLFAEFVGLYFPLMAVLAVDLRARLSKIIFGSLIGFNLIVSVVMIYGWITETTLSTDFSKTFPHYGVKGLLFFAAVHFLPTFVFAFLLIRSIMRGKSQVEDDSLISLKLP